jgi:hypothetical protein
LLNLHWLWQPRVQIEFLKWFNEEIVGLWEYRMAGTAKHPHGSSDVNDRGWRESCFANLSQHTFEGISIRPKMGPSPTLTAVNFQSKPSKEPLKESLHDSSVPS